MIDRMKLNRSPLRGLVQERPLGRGIPRIIHQTFHAPPWPDAYVRNAQTLRTMNPGWDYCFHDYEARETFIRNVYGGDILARYLSINPEYGAARADFFRYLLLYEKGGVYLDMKSGTSRPLDDVLLPDDSFLVSTWRDAEADRFQGWGQHPEVQHLPFGEFQQWFIAAAPGHPFLKAVIELVLGNIARYVHGLHSHGAYAVLRVTGPVPYTLAIAPLLDRYPHRMVDSFRDLGLIYSTLDGGTARTHTRVGNHYTTLTTSLIHMDFPRSFASRVFDAGKAVYRTIRRR